MEPLLARLPLSHRKDFLDMLRLAWQILMQCHAHDSICSCHSDLVAHDVMNRLSRCLQLAESLEQEILVQLIGVRPNEQEVSLPGWLLVHNPLPWELHVPLTVTLDVPAGTHLDKLSFVQDGQIIPAVVTSSQEICRWTEHYYGKVLNKTRGTQRLSVLLQPRLDGGAFTRLEIRAAAGAQREQASLLAGDNILDNGLLRAVVHADGRLDLTEPVTGYSICGLNRLIDEPERGDLYEHARDLSGQSHSPDEGHIQVKQDSALRATLHVHSEIDCSGISCPLASEISLDAGKPYLAIRTTLDNQSTDHWLRVAFPIPEGCGDIMAHTPFDLVKRRVEDGNPFRDGDRIRFAKRLGQAMQYGVLAICGPVVMGVFNRGLYEYLFENENELSITLMRFVGLIREDLTSYSACEANRKGPLTVEYAVGLWPAKQITAVLRAMYEYNVTPRSFQVFERPPESPAGGIDFSNPYWMPSAFKPAESGGGSILRFWNASDSEQAGSISIHPRPDTMSRVRMDETGATPVMPNLLTSPKEIVTLHLPEQRTTDERL